ncbi:Fc.00g079330.m01.CDS01 [Cosmosporella sp. VM-42]
MYCSNDCQKEDLSTHKVLCKRYAAKSEPQFIRVEVENETHLLAHHPVIEKWKIEMEDRYEKHEYKVPDSDPLVIRALSKDLVLEGKRFGHGLRVVYWPPPNGELGYMEDFNFTVFSLAHSEKSKNISSLMYGPVIAFAYTLGSQFELNGIDDMNTNDFRHIVDYFRNSHWNPTIGDAKRSPQKVIPSLFVPDTTHALRHKNDDMCAGSLLKSEHTCQSCTKWFLPRSISSRLAGMSSAAKISGQSQICF